MLYCGLVCGVDDSGMHKDDTPKYGEVSLGRERSVHDIGVHINNKHYLNGDFAETATQ